MNELDYIGADELVFNNDIKEGIHSGGFNIKSIMLKGGMSPIMTLNTQQIGGGEKVSDLFNDLVIPNWTLSYNNRISGGKYKEVEHNDSDEDDTIEDDLHEKLLDLVKEHNIKQSKDKGKGLIKKRTRKNKVTKHKSTRRKILIK